MPKCPSCNAELDMDFGMVTCSECQSVLMVDITGQVHLASDEAIASYDEDDIEDSFEETDQETSSFENEDSFESDDSSNNDDQSDSINEDWGGSFDEEDQDYISNHDNDEQDSSLDSNEFSESDSNSDFNPSFSHFDEDNTTDEDNLEESSDVESPNEELNSNNYEQDSPSQFEEEGESDEDLGQFSMPATPDTTPVDISEFANSEQSNIEEGELLYDIKVSRIDSKDLRDEVKFVLMDEKLKLNHGELLKKIKTGKLLIPDLNPIKAKRIVEQLQYSDLDIKWKQKRVIIETVEAEEDYDQGDSFDGEEEV